MTSLIHVGFPKTGTSSLQRCAYPNIDEINYISQDHKLFNYFLRISSFDEIHLDLDYIKQKLNELDDYIISWERLIGDIQDCFAGHTNNARILSQIAPEAKILITIRRQDEWTRSIYQQYLGRGYLGSFETFLSYKEGEFKDYGKYTTPWNKLGSVRTYNVRLPNYLRFRETYVELFGEENVCVLPLELMIQDWPRFSEIFSQFTGHVFKAEDTPGTSRGSNKNYRTRANLLQRFINCFARTPDNPIGFLPIKKRYWHKIRFLDVRRLHSVIGRILGGRDLLREELALKIMEIHSADNKSLDQNIKADLSRFGYY